LLLFRLLTAMPTSKHRISLSLDDDEYARLSSVALQSRVSMAWLARQALIEFLERQKDQRATAPVPLRVSQEAAR
jgi:predicted transcriptional regulator